MMTKLNMKKSDAPSINIQSYIRVRPLAPKEKKACALEFGKKEVTIKSSADSSKIGKTLLFDRVFDEESKQITVYNSVVKPMIKEVLQGYNCTVFAYGQTGTGKTYTMTGDQGDSHTSWEENIHAGIVPRAMQDLFTELANQPCEYQVSVSYMELYNEKLRSLLKDTLEETNIQLIDDLEGGVILKGLLPTPVKTKEEAFRLLQQGTEKKQVAATMLNMNSSRSHTIFTINVNIKENLVAGKDDILRCGKLHLVDLAGSENVSKSGASENIHKTATGVNKRLAEASNINKSLLTLGRVITCLTENNPHIPYRESKLTRFLRDSLGGRTKTCIIGNISPAQANLDETESTLNYAYKARSIKNKPEKNQTISKKDFMQVASEEIMKLKKDLEAVRQGEGFYISKESHDEMITRMKELDNQVKDWHDKYSRIKESYEQTKEMFSSLSSDFDDKCAEYEELEKVFHQETEKCKEKMSEFAKEIVVREYFIKEYEKTENRLTEQAKTCKSVLENLLEQSNLLHDKIDRKQSNELDNVQLLSQYKNNVTKKVADFQKKLDDFFNEDKIFVQELNKYAANLADMVAEENVKVMSSISAFGEKMKVIVEAIEAESLDIQSDFEDGIKSTQVVKDEKLKYTVGVFQDFITSQILPTMKNTHDQFTLVEKTAEEGKKKLSKYTARQAELMAKVTENRQYLTESMDRTMSEIASIGGMNKHISKGALAIHSNTEQASQKMEQLIKLAEEVIRQGKATQDTLNAIETDTCSVIEDSKYAAERANCLESTVKSELEEYRSDDLQLVQAVERVSHDLVNHAECVLSEIEEKVENLSAEDGSHLSSIKSCVDKQIQEMQTLSDKEEKCIAKLTSTVNKFSNHVAQTKMSYSGTIVCHTEEIKEQLDQGKCRLENVLREQLNRNQLKLNQTHDDNKMIQVIKDLEQDLRTVSYEEYVPLGTTPQRLCKDRLQYPRKFDSTAPRVELVKKLKEKYPETESVPNENIYLKYLPQGEFFCGEISPSSVSSPSSVKSSQSCAGESVNFDVECTPEARAHALRRKSTSLPDLKNVLDDVFLAPSPVQNKENVRSRSARKAVKTKIPDVAKTKRKNVLAAVQEYNSV